mmetsp:Transcript_5156/g.19334  ORF Transcript_5156/g.19334 Transcript_5156/m.19334 type:complete len:109 (+) Transcript_5156:73-399(+)
MPLFSQLTLHAQRSNRQKAARGMKQCQKPVWGRFSRKTGHFLFDKTKIPLIIPPASQSKVSTDANSLNDLRPYVSMSAKKLPRGALGESYYIERVIGTNEAQERTETA